MRIEDYGLIGDLQTAALVGRDGSIDWLCFPRFDSGACFSALLGNEWDGRWLLAPDCEVERVERRYRDRTLVHELDFHCATGSVRVIDFMPPRGRDPDVVRIVEGLEGSVPMRLELMIRFEYGSIVPWVRRVDEETRVAIAGPDALALRTSVPMRGENLRTVADFTIERGRAEAVRAHLVPVAPRDSAGAITPDHALEDTCTFWHEWLEACEYQGRWEDAVTRSLMVLKALTYDPTGGIVAAPTTSLPEQIGGVRNWDYRYCWLRDATFTLDALLESGFTSEAEAWRSWLLRAIAGDPDDIQIMYGPAGERRLPEYELPWLAGYESSRPVRVGNDASAQFQLDVYGEVMDVLHQARRQRHRAGRPVLGPAAGAAREPGGALARTGRGDLGGARPAPPLRPLEGDGVGRVRPGRQGGRAVRPQGRGRPLAALPRRDHGRGARARLERGAGLLRPVLRLRTASTRAS